MKQLKDLIKIVEGLILSERMVAAEHGNTAEKELLELTSDSGTLQDVFHPLSHWIDIISSVTAKDITVGSSSKQDDAVVDEQRERYEIMIQPGTRVKVRWTKDVLGDSGWQVGWYTAEVQAYEDTDMLIFLNLTVFII